MIEELKELLDGFYHKADSDDRYGTWVQDATNKNYDKKILTVTDLLNYLRNDYEPPKPKEK